MDIRIGEPTIVEYTNWRGETAVRKIIPRAVWEGTTEWHPEHQTFVKALDVAKNEMRDFALKDMKQINLTMAVAESLTCGTLQSVVGVLPGASKFFHGGITCYSLEQKVRHLGVDQEHARECACVSSKVAREMAMGVCKLFGSDLGFATTGYASPDPQTGKLIAWVCFHDGRSNTSHIRFVSSPPTMGREQFQRLVAKSAIELFFGFSHPGDEHFPIHEHLSNVMKNLS